MSWMWVPSVTTLVLSSWEELWSPPDDLESSEGAGVNGQDATPSSQNMSSDLLRSLVDSVASLAGEVKSLRLDNEKSSERWWVRQELTCHLGCLGQRPQRDMLQILVKI